MTVLIIGSGGREHALAWKLARSPRVRRILCAPGNAGTAALGENLPIPITDAAGLLAAAARHDVNFTVIGPDDALAAGVADAFEAAGRRVFGPRRDAARLEWSKGFAKDFCRRHAIPTAGAEEFDDLGAALAHLRARERWPVVLKADGLAAGKGVVVAAGLEEAEAAVRAMLEERRFGAAGARVLAEDYLTGSECSLHALVDGRRAVLLPLAQDHKRLLDGDAGPNTGGMGTVSPPSAARRDPELAGRLEREMMAPFLAGLAADGLDFRGLLFPGVMLTPDGPRVLEFNARFGDPETQVLLPRLRSDLLPLLEACAGGHLDQAPVPEWDSRVAVCVILASENYPGKPLVGRPIHGLEDLADAEDVMVFHAGTRRGDDGIVRTSGGRVLGVTALCSTVEEARARAYEAADRIRFDGKHCRRDIAAS